MWSLEVIDGGHNHEETDPDACPSLRREERNQDMLDRLDSATKGGLNVLRQFEYMLTSIVGATPREFFAEERLNNPSTLLSPQDIYNAKKKLRSRRLGRYTPTQALLKHLDHDNWFVKVKLRKETKEIQRLFFLSKKSGQLLLKNHEVLIMDCTYKTNKYRISLLTIVGHTAIDTTFHVGFAFLSSESPEDYA